MASQLRVQWQTFGGHVHTRWFMADSRDHDFASLGSLVARPDEWDLIEALLRVGKERFPDDIEVQLVDRDVDGSG